MDNVVPLVAYVKQQQQQEASHALYDVHIERAVDIKQIIVGHFSRIALYNILKKNAPAVPTFERDAFSRKDLYDAVDDTSTSISGKAVYSVVIDNLFGEGSSGLAEDDNGLISEAEIMELFQSVQTMPRGTQNPLEYVSMASLNRSVASFTEDYVTKDILLAAVENKFSKHSSQAIVDNIFESMDPQRTGRVAVAEIRKLVAEAESSDDVTPFTTADSSRSLI